MMMTETEAKEKACPSTMRVRVVGGLSATLDPVVDKVVDYGNCIGERCMAWRSMSNDNDKVGYCGLGG